MILGVYGHLWVLFDVGIVRAKQVRHRKCEDEVER